MKIAVNTGGGDAPGLNAVIRSVVLAANQKGWEVYGIKYGYRGLVDTKQIIRLTPEDVWDITNIGGTILGTAIKGDPFNFPVTKPDGSVVETDISDTIISNFKALGFDALIAIGGDGSLRIANKFFQKGMPIIGVPKTIDNDISFTDVSFGFDTAVNTATEAIDKLHTTAKSHDRVMVVEVMGRYVGWIALHSGISGSADAILIPEIPFDLAKVCNKIRQLALIGKDYAIVVVAEGAKPIGGEITIMEKSQLGGEVRLGGIGRKVSDAIGKITGKETRHIVLGHLQRGGAPTTFDRLLALRFGSAAMRFVEAGKFGTMAALHSTEVVSVPIEEAIGQMKSVSPDSDIIITARSLGISFGD
ncbi:MAG TPA: ATP-dependent 6-phosphofructokinase [Thermodesulfovibrionales bacterium]|jgi:phosphofructokinase-like protein|nr:ATP-dependent 6-phosphofructokinase [Thermodesulfovibrionales bacterium]